MEESQNKEPQNEQVPRTYDGIMSEVNGKFNELMDLSRRGSAPLDLTRSGALLPKFDIFDKYLERCNKVVPELTISEFHRDQLVGFLDSRLLTIKEYIKILQSNEEARKKGDA